VPSGMVFDRIPCPGRPHTFSNSLFLPNFAKHGLYNLVFFLGFAGYGTGHKYPSLLLPFGFHHGPNLRFCTPLRLPAALNDPGLDGEGYFPVIILSLKLVYKVMILLIGKITFHGYAPSPWNLKPPFCLGSIRKKGVFLCFIRGEAPLIF
jgi:hypothetical protein